MAAASASQRRKTAYAQAAAAKQKRQKVIAIAGAVLLVLVLAYEIPHTLSLLHNSSSPGSAVVAPPAVTTAAPSNAATKLRAARHHVPVDPFAGSTPAAEPGFGQVAAPHGERDPFVASGTGSVSSTPVTPPTVTPPVQLLPKQIVIGAPGAGRVAVKGWILILASIPTNEGRGKATVVADKARNNGLTFVSVLNSSNRRPLRGGYWVVYTGPYPSLGSVNSASTHVHASGFGDAYIRQLIVYKKR